MSLTMRSLLVVYTSLTCCLHTFAAVDSQWEPLAGYTPVTDIREYLALSHDLAAMTRALDRKTEDGLGVAYDIYHEGAYSRSYANLSLSQPLDEPVERDTPFQAKSLSGGTVTLNTMKQYKEGDSYIQLWYKTGSVNDKTGNCQVGGNPKPLLGGCKYTMTVVKCA
jgi:hypothetical protein